MSMVTVLKQEFFTPEKVAYLLQVTPRTLNRWAADPQAYPAIAEKLAPKTMLNGRRMYPAENILAVYNESFGRNLTLEELKQELNEVYMQS
jgi:hypothetical protein